MVATVQRDSHSYTEDEVRRFVRQGEGTTVELKAGVPEPSLLARHIGSFANNEGGVILLGVEERGAIVGCDISRARRVYRAALERLSPIAETKFHQLEIANKTVVLVEVFKSDGPVLVDGGAYVRIGAHTEAMTADDMLTFFKRTKPPVHTLESLALAITQQTQIIEKLRQELFESGRLKNRLKEWLISGVIGAVLGWVVTKILVG